jgi:hypothetical protein
LRELFADRESRIADLANEIVPAGDEFDDLIFDQPDFAQTVLNFRRGAELLDPDSNAGLNAIQGANSTLIRFAQVRLDLPPVHALRFMQSWKSGFAPIAECWTYFDW